jgi:hypothetical protein
MSEICPGINTKTSGGAIAVHIMSSDSKIAIADSTFEANTGA